MRFRFKAWWLLVTAAATVSGVAHAGERITLTNGFSVSCDHHLPLDADRVRLFLDAAAANYVDVSRSSIVSAEAESEIKQSGASLAAAGQLGPAAAGVAPSQASLDLLIHDAGRARSLNVDLLWSVVTAESGGRARAVSRVGAQGLMQLMPSTAQSLGVRNSFEPSENLRGGTGYLDALLRRYHDDLPLALAAYNAGPGAVDRYHGIPPFRETRLYVARVIREFNKRTVLAQRARAASNATATREAITTQ